MSEELKNNECCNKGSDKISPEIISRKVINMNVKEDLTKLNFTRTRKLDENDVRLNANNPKVTVKTYTKKIVRRRGPDGEFTEEIHEEGEPLTDLLANISDQKTDIVSNTVICGEADFETSLKENTINESGVTDTKELSYPTRVVFNRENNNSYPVGTTITKTIKHNLSESETRSAKTSGEMRTTFSKTKTQSISGTGKMEVKSKDGVNENQLIINGEEVETLQPSCSNENEPVIVEPEISKETKTQCMSEPTDIIDKDNNPDTLLPSRVHELEKILDLGAFSKDLDISSQELVKEGVVKVWKTLQKFSKPLKSISKKGPISFNLIVLSELLLITIKKSEKELLLLEYCDKSCVDTSIYEHPNQNGGEVKSKNTNKSNLLCGSGKRAKTLPEYSFVMKFSKKNLSLLTESLVCSVATREDRDQWISVLRHT